MSEMQQSPAKKDFKQQHLYVLEINKNQAATDEAEDWMRLARGVKSIDLDNNEEVEEYYYYDGEGNAESGVTGMQKAVEIELDREYNDPAQNLIFNTMAHDVGNIRNIAFRITYPDGTKILGPATVTDIKEPSGEPQNRGECSFSIKFAGKPKVTPAKGK